MKISFRYLSESYSPCEIKLHLMPKKYVSTGLKGNYKAEVTDRIEIKNSVQYLQFGRVCKIYDDFSQKKQNEFQNKLKNLSVILALIGQIILLLKLYKNPSIISINLRLLTSYPSSHSRLHFAFFGTSSE